MEWGGGVKPSERTTDRKHARGGRRSSKQNNIVLTPRMEWALDSLHHRVTQRITGSQPQRWGYGSWEYPPLAEEMGEVVFKGIRKLVTRRQKKVAQYIATQPILDLYEQATWRLGERVPRRWW